MSKSENNEDTSNSQNIDYWIPILKLPNVRALTDEFGDSIERMTAHGSCMERSSLNSNKQYGFEANSENSVSVTIDYDKKRDNNGNVRNPLNNKAIDNIQHSIDKNLRSIKQNPRSINYDIPVNEIIVKVDSTEIAQAYNVAETNTFYLRFELERGAGFTDSIKSVVEPLFERHDLTKQKFQWRIPVLREIIPKTGFDYAGNDHETVFSWNPSDIETTPLEVSTAQKVCSTLPRSLERTQNVEKVNDEYWGMK